MIASMTAYAQKAMRAPWGELVWELRSVNHRFLDVSLRLPDTLSHVEMAVRDQFKRRLGRGKLNASLSYRPGEQAPFSLDVNSALLQQLAAVADKARERFEPLHTDFSRLLSWPGLLTVSEQQSDELIAAVHDLLETTLTELIDTRQREGQQLKQVMVEKLDQISQQLVLVNAQIPTIEATLRERLLLRAADVGGQGVELDPGRVEQEVLFCLQKADVVEEIERLQTHVKETLRVLEQGGVVGRRLDFLAQELQREANTIGSKAADASISNVSIELKVLIEQIREQVQNIE